MRSLVLMQMASRLVAGLAHIFLFRKLLKKLRPHRCEFCTERCTCEEPPMTEISEGHFVRCFRAEKEGT